MLTSPAREFETGGYEPAADTLLRIFEATADPIAMFDGAGRLVRTSGTLRKRLDGVDGRVLRPALHSFATHVALSGRQQCVGAVVQTIDARDVSGALGAYRLVGIYCGAAVLDVISTVLIRVRIDSQLSTELGELFRKHNLTRKQAAVAELMARGLRNGEIAQKLFISEHTARHHVEQVLSKMGVRTRTALVARLLECGTSWESD